MRLYLKYRYICTYLQLNNKLASKVDTNDTRLYDARTPTEHTHDDRYPRISVTRITELSYDNNGIFMVVDNATKFYLQTK